MLLCRFLNVVLATCAAQAGVECQYKETCLWSPKSIRKYYNSVLLCTCAAQLDEGLQYKEPGLISALPQLTEFGHRGEEYIVHVDNGTLDVAIAIHRLRNDGGVPIVLTPGIVTGSIIYLSAGRESFGYLLADAGYDVWLINTRGSSFAYKPYNWLNQNANEFWETNPSLTIEHDMPILFEYILQKTNQTKMYAGCFSQGCMLVQGMLSVNERINGLVDLVINVGPHLYFRDNVWNMMRVVCRLLNLLSNAPQLGFQRMPLFHPNSALMKLLFGDKCRTKPWFCRIGVHFVLSPLSKLLSWEEYNDYNATNYKKYWGHLTPIGSATSHYIHADRSERIGFARYQQNPTDGVRPYNLSAVKATQMMFYCSGNQDVTSSQAQNDELIETFGGRLRYQLVWETNCKHLGFILDSRGEHYRKVIAQVREFDENPSLAAATKVDRV